MHKKLSGKWTQNYLVPTVAKTHPRQLKMFELEQNINIDAEVGLSNEWCTIVLQTKISLQTGV